MTNQEYVTVVLGKFGLSESEIEFVLTEADLTPGATVDTPEDKVKVKKAIFYQVPLLIAGLSDVSEGGYSVKWNIAGLKAWYSVLASELGLEDSFSVTPKVRDKSNRW